MENKTVIVTATPLDKVDERMRWFDVFFPWFDKGNIIIESDKAKAADRFDVLVDDYLVNVESVGPKKCVVYTQLHNVGYTHARGRVDNWRELYDWLEENR